MISNTINKPSQDEIERCKTVMSSYQMMPMFSVKDIIIGSIGTTIPWIILLIIVGILIII
jgi:hypothetical protein